MRLLNQFIQLKSNNPGKLEEVAAQITQGLKQMDVVELDEEDPFFQPKQVDRGIQSILNQLDMRRGGLAKAPKFPMPSIHEWLLQHQATEDNEQALQAVLLTLDEMRMGGIYDHVGGGFARYSTDEKWLVPHFEKMLYDNSQLVSLYAHAYQATKDPTYQQVIEETLSFIKREMTSPEGGFYSSLDADSEGEEGKFYIWTKAEIEAVLGTGAERFCEIYQVSEGGNWEGHNILHLKRPLAEWAEELGMGLEELQAELQAQRAQLLTEREKRIRPGLDDKQLTAWNALMLKGYVDAYRVLGKQEYLDIALRNAAFLKKHLQRKDGGFNRTFKDGSSAINAFADDYGLVIHAWIALYQVTFEERWLKEARDLMDYTLEGFFDPKSGLFFYTAKEDAPLITRSREIPDNVIPGANSILAKDLYLLGTYFYHEPYLAKSKKMVQAILPQLQQDGAYYANWGQLLSWLTTEPYEVAIVGADAVKKRAEMDQAFLPQAIFLGGTEEGSLELLQNKSVPGATFIYVCQHKVCQLPVEETARALELMKNQ